MACRNLVVGEGGATKEGPELAKRVSKRGLGVCFQLRLILLVAVTPAVVSGCRRGRLCSGRRRSARDFFLDLVEGDTNGVEIAPVDTILLQ